MLTGFDIASTLPFAVAVCFGIVVLLLEVFQRPSFSRGYLSYVAAFGFVLTAVAALGLRKLGGHGVFGGMSHLDGYSQTFTVIFCVAGGASALVAPGWLGEQRVDRGEYYALLLFSVAGMIMMVSAGDFAVFFVGLELLRGETADGVTVYVSHSEWASEAAFSAWTRSEAFRKAHADARSPAGTLAGPPRFAGYGVVLAEGGRAVDSA